MHAVAHAHNKKNGGQNGHHQVQFVTRYPNQSDGEQNREQNDEGWDDDAPEGAKGNV